MQHSLLLRNFPLAKVMSRQGNSNATARFAQWEVMQNQCSCKYYINSVGLFFPSLPLSVSELESDNIQDRLNSSSSKRNEEK